MDTNKHIDLTAAEHLLKFQEFEKHPVIHGMYNRHGGISPAPWDSNNVSYGLGDSSDNVSANREKIKGGQGYKHLVSARQIHSSRVYCVSDEPAGDLEIDGYDALITSLRGLGLMIQQADCQAVMLYDPVIQAAGIAHVGWRGSVANIIAETVFAMSQTFSTESVDIIAAISPSLGPCCAEFVNYHSELPAALHGYQVRPNYLNFWDISRDQLCAAGVRPENIHIAEICTCCNHDFFSYRRDRDTGRFASVIGIKSPETNI
jgi:YfiH family protein